MAPELVVILVIAGAGGLTLFFVSRIPKASLGGGSPVSPGDLGRTVTLLFMALALCICASAWMERTAEEEGRAIQGLFGPLDRPEMSRTQAVISLGAVLVALGAVAVVVAKGRGRPAPYIQDPEKRAFVEALDRGDRLGFLASIAFMAVVLVAVAWLQCRAGAPPP